MPIYNIEGDALTNAYNVYGLIASQVYDVEGNIINSGDYSEYDNEYQHTILQARDEALLELRGEDDVIFQVLHTDQHNRFDRMAPLFSYLGVALKWEEVSAFIGLGDVTNYNVPNFQTMLNCLNGIPTSKQINIWGNHETWTPEWGQDISVPTTEEWETLNYYYDNSSFNGYQFMPGTKCSQYMIDPVNHIKYVVIGGWDYDLTIGGHGSYVIDSDNMESIISMLSGIDNNDIVILSHIQPFRYNKLKDTWTIPYEDACGGGGWRQDMTYANIGTAGNTLDDILIGRKNKTSGTAYDTYGNSHSYDFTNCTSDLLCCYAGHEHCNWYNHQNGNIPVSIFDAYAYDTHPFYFVNINRTKRWINVWRVDDTPQIVRYQIPFVKAS